MTRACIGLILMVGVVGCGPQPMVCGNSGTGGFGAAGPEPAPGTGGGFGGVGGGTGQGTKVLGVVGKPVTVVLGIPAPTDTCGTPLKVDEVVTEVFDPANHPVEHTKTALHAGTIDTFGFQQQATVTDLTFTPQMPGSYHLAARFEPTRGNAQTDLDVAADRTASPSKTLALGTTCVALEVMASGLTLCLKDTDQLVMFRDEMSLAQALDADDFAVAGDVVWTTRFGLVKRYVEATGSSPLVNPMSYDTGLLDRGTLIATQTDAVYVANSTVARVEVNNGALVEAGRVYPQSLGWNAQATGVPGLVLLASSGLVCTTDVKAGTSPGCMAVGGTLLGSDRSGVWFTTGATLDHQRWDGTRLVRTSMAFPGLATPLVSRHFESAPVLTVEGRIIVPRLGPDGIELDSYELPAGYSMVPGSTKTLRAQNAATGAQRLFTRP